MPAEEPGAIWIPTPNCWANRYGHKPTFLILHGTASPNAFYAQDIAHYFQNTAADSSVHYVVGRDGAIAQCVSEHDAAWGNGIIEPSPTKPADPWWSKDLNPNLITISIEHVQPDPNNETGLTPLQQEASFRLISHICDRWNIPKRSADSTGGITGHYSIDPLNRLHCPGNYPWDALWTSLKEKKMIDLSNPLVANYFVLWQGNWKCKQKTTDGTAIPDTHIIRGNILSFYQSVGGVGLNGVTLLGLPVEDDHPLLDGEGKVVPNGLEQRFERGIVRYDPEHIVDHPPQSSDCYLAHVNDLYGAPRKVQNLTQELAQQNSANTQLEGQIGVLKAQLKQIQETKQTTSIDIAALVEEISQELLTKVRQSVGTAEEQTQPPQNANAAPSTSKNTSAT